jgi:hypothetical protein
VRVLEREDVEVGGVAGDARDARRPVWSCSRSFWRTVIR